MAQLVVDLLEAVEVAEQHRRVVAGGEGLLEPVGEQHAVGQAGQRVVDGLVADVAHQPCPLQRGRRLVGHAPQAQDQLAGTAGRSGAGAPARGRHAEQLVARQQRDGEDVVDVERFEQRAEHR